MISTEEKVTLTIPMQFDAQVVWSSVFGSSFEQMGEHWRVIKYQSDADWETPGEVVIGIEDPDDPDNTITKVLGIKEVTEALEKRLTMKSIGGELVHDISVWDNDLDLDACEGDAVLQIALLSDVVYG